MHSVLKTGHPSRLYAAVMLASMLMLSAQAGATTLLKKNFDDLVTEADAIVVGTVSDTQSHYGPDRKIYTLVTLTDLQVVHGRYQASSLTLQLPGGRIQNDAMVVHGSPRLAVKDRVVLFLQGNGRQMVPFVGWIQGVFRLEPDAKTGRQRIVDHDRNPVVEVRGSELLKDEINTPDATIVSEIGKPGVESGGGKDDAGVESVAPTRPAAAGREAIDAATFIRAIVSKAREKQAVGRAVQSVVQPAASDQPGQDAPPPQR
jgi:hypothetical protein